MPSRLSPQIVDFFDDNLDLFEEHPNLWVKGGPARDALLTYFSDQEGLVVRRPTPTRDIDLVLIEDEQYEHSYVEAWLAEIEDRCLDGLSSQPLAGCKIDFESIGSFDQYFQSRDIGINEVLLRPYVLLFSAKAERDARRRQAVPTMYEFSKETGIRARVALRTVLTAVRERVGFRPNKSLVSSVGAADSFDLLVHLLKAYETGVADDFYQAIQWMTPTLEPFASPEAAVVGLARATPHFRLSPRQARVIQQARGFLNDRARWLQYDPLSDEDDFTRTT